MDILFLRSLMFLFDEEVSIFVVQSLAISLENQNGQNHANPFSQGMKEITERNLHRPKIAIEIGKAPMHLIYFDESGQTGTNLRDPVQTIFVLGALVVPETAWLAIEKDLQAAIDKYFPLPRPNDFEIHATEISNPRNGYFKQYPIAQRLAFRDEWFLISQKHSLKFIYRSIVKKRFQDWSHATFGAGISINPHIAAFPLVARVVDDLLKSLPGSPLGIFISDENREVVRDIEKAIKILRGMEGVLKLGQIVEKGFFIESEKSLVLQLCDLCVYTARRRDEQKAGLPIKAIDQSGIPLIEPLIHIGDECFRDVNAWLTAEQKKGRPGN